MRARTSLLVRVVPLVLLATSCTSASPADPEVSTTAVAAPIETTDVDQTATAAPEPSTTTTTEAADAAPPPDPLMASTTCAELWNAATPVLQAALGVLDEELGGQSEAQILDLPSDRIETVFDRMASVDRYNLFSQRRDELECTNATDVRSCDQRQSELDDTRLDPMLQLEWLSSLGCPGIGTAE